MFFVRIAFFPVFIISPLPTVSPVPDAFLYHLRIPKRKFMMTDRPLNPDAENELPQTVENAAEPATTTDAAQATDTSDLQTPPEAAPLPEWLELTDFTEATKETLLERSRQVQSHLSDERFNFKAAEALYTQLRNRMRTLDEAEREEARLKYEAQAQSEEEKEGFEFQRDTLSRELSNHYKALRDAKKAYYEGIEKRKQRNLVEKKAILEQIRTLIEGSGNSIKTDLEALKALQTRFKEIGGVPAAQSEELYRNYRALLDQFFSKKAQERELIALDRQRNLSAKKALIERAQEIAQNPNTRKAIEEFKALNEEYRRIGRAPKEESEALWQQLKDIADALFAKKRSEDEAYRAERQANMEAKQALCLQVEAFVGFQSDSFKEWNEKTREILELQKQWDSIGAAPREVAKDLNKQFWKNFKDFFRAKTQFFEKVDAERQKNLEQKQALIARANELKESDDWENTASLLKDLQNQWREVGSVPEKFKESLYQEFKTAVDYFFERKRNRKNLQAAEWDKNLAKKQAICEQLESLAAANSQEVETLKAHYHDFNKIGFVPANQIRNIQERFEKAIKAFLAASGLDSEAQNAIQTELALKSIGDNPLAIKQLRNKERTLRTKISAIENDIQLWRNNLEFFAASKTADKLRAEFDTKIQAAQAQIKDIQKELQVIEQAIQADKEANRATDTPSEA